MDLNSELIKLAWYSLGFIYSIFAGLIISHTQKLYYSGFEEGKKPEWRPKVTGLVERGLYTASILVGFLAFVGIWLGVKTISHWEIFKSDYSRSPQKKKTIDEGNTMSTFKCFFLLTGLSVAYGFAGALIAISLIDSHILSAVTLAVSLIVLHLLLNMYIGAKTKDEKNKKDITQLNLGDE